MLNIVRDVILLNFNVRLTKLPQMEFTEMINIGNGKSSHSQQSNPNMISDEYDQQQSGNVTVVTFRRVHRLVSNVTYFTWLHNCKRDKQSKLKNPEARMRTWKIL